jgi:hypothetical protein
MLPCSVMLKFLLALKHASPRADHVVSTMAAAESAGVLALGQLWYDRTYAKAPLATGLLLNTEIVHQATWLAKVWDGEARQVLVGVGDQLNATSGKLLAYADFGSASYALQARFPFAFISRRAAGPIVRLTWNPCSITE